MNDINKIVSSIFKALITISKLQKILAESDQKSVMLSKMQKFVQKFGLSFSYCMGSFDFSLDKKI